MEDRDMTQFRTLAIATVVLALAGVTMASAVRQDREVAVERHDRMGPSSFDWMGSRDGRFGVVVRDIEPSEDASAIREGLKGAAIQTVRDGSPAETAGLRVDDVILAFDGEDVRSARHLVRLVSETPSGRPVQVTVRRDGARLDVPVTLGDRGPADGRGWTGFDGRFGVDVPEIELPHIRLPQFSFDVRAREGRLGLGVLEVSDQLAEYFGVDHGVLVTAVREGSPGADAGLKAGDVIVAADGARVDGVADLWRHASRADQGAVIELAIVRDRQPRSVSVTLPSTARRTRGEPI